MVWPPDTTTSTPSERKISSSPEPAATATKPSGFLGSSFFSPAAWAWSAAILAVRSWDSMSMLWMKTS